MSGGEHDVSRFKCRLRGKWCISYIKDTTSGGENTGVLEMDGVGADLKVTGYDGSDG